MDRPIEGSGKAEITLASGTIEGLKRFLMSLDKITVDRMHARAELEKGRMRLQEFSLEAKELSASITGEIVPAPRLGNSRLNLRIEAAIDPVVRKQHRIPFDPPEPAVKRNAFQAAGALSQVIRPSEGDGQHKSEPALFL